MEGLRPFVGDDNTGTASKGPYFDNWIKLKPLMSELYILKDGHVVRGKDPIKCERPFPTLGGYTAVLSDMGRLLKFNPNPLNFKFGSRQRAFDRCLVKGCGLPTNDMWGLCSATSHTHWGEIKTRHGRKTVVTWDWVPMSRMEHVVDWEGSLKEDSSTRRIFAPEHSAMAELLVGWAEGSKERGDLIDAFVRDLLKDLLVGKVKDSTTMQLEFEGGADPAGELVERIRVAVDAHFQGIDELVDWPRKDVGIFKDVNVKSVATMMALGFAAEEANRNDLWFIKEVQGFGAERSRYASSYMSAVYFLLRRAGASPNQARMSQRTM
jgi:hypothetical protein